MWGYLVLGVIIGMLILMLLYCIWSFVDDCHTTQDTVQRLECRTDNLRYDLTRLENQVSFLKKRMKEVNELRVQNTPHNEEDRQEKGE